MKKLASLLTNKRLTDLCPPMDISMLYAFVVKFRQDRCNDLGTHLEIFSRNSIRSCAFSRVEKFEMFHNFIYCDWI